MSLSASINTRLEHQHETISELIDGFSESSLKQRINPDKWSAFENIVHLASYQLTFIERIKLILEGTKPQFERYVAENDPLFYEYLQKSLVELKEDILSNRFVMIGHLKYLNEKQLGLSGHHPRFGDMTIGQWTEFFLLHEAHHLYTIMQLVAALRVTQQ